MEEDLYKQPHKLLTSFWSGHPGESSNCFIPVEVELGHEKTAAARFHFVEIFDFFVAALRCPSRFLLPILFLPPCFLLPFAEFCVGCLVLLGKAG